MTESKSISEIIETKPSRKTNQNVMIVRQSTKLRIFRNIPEEFIPSDSFEKEYKGSWIHVLGLQEIEKEDKGKEYRFWPIEVEPAEEGMSPTDLYMAKNCAEEVNEWYGMSQPLVEKIKLGIFFGLCIGILIVIFLLVASAGSV